ncbi:MAG: flagellar biosynthesis protein FlhB [Sedimentisphaerales bacterium]|nr:flagellar biosynthesis protein FlhB [Sedimentisphaerales bacterium]
MPGDTGEKTEAPTPRRLQEAREKGQVAKSTDLSAAVGLLASLILISLYGPSMMSGFLDIMRESFALDNVLMDRTMMADQAWRIVVRHTAAMVAPFFMLLFVTAIVVNVAQVGFLLTAQPITPSLNKISPIAGVKRLFSIRTLVRMVMNLGKVGIVSAVAYITIKQDIPQLINVTNLDWFEVGAVGAEMLFVLGLRMAAVLLILAIFDYAFQKFQMNRDLRMSHEEVREEMKRMEGDPLMRQRRRNVARQLANQRMAQAVPTADVVITNPTHLAIALKYERDMPAPKVVARGAGFLAQRIRTIANENGVPIVERKPLARALYKACEVGDYVPPELFKAVAEVLAYVFELAGKGYRRRASVG